jgi:hypothetical protein
MLEKAARSRPFLISAGKKNCLITLTFFFTKRTNFRKIKPDLWMAFKLHNTFKNYLLTKLKGGTL